MVASDSNGSIRNGIRRLLRNEWFIAVAILVTAMAVRWEFHLWNPHPTGFFIYHGSPISDGSSYTFKAINIAKGYGIPPTQQPAIRPFYSIVLVGWRKRTPKAAGIHAFLLLFGFFSVMLPWLIRQERLYGIVSLSDNIGEAIYAATSPLYKRWTPAVRKDADAAGIPNTIRDRYRYFIDRSVENVKTNPRFYLRNVGAALWEYANTFSPRSRAANRYQDWFSSAAQGQRVLLFYLLAFTLLMWLLRRDSPFAPSSLLFLLISIGLVVLFRILPSWATFVPVVSGFVFTWMAGRRMPNLILAGTLVAAVLGSAVFANSVLFRAILMTDWLFLLYFLAAIWFPAESLSRRLAGEPQQGSAAGTEDDEPSSFQSALSLISRRSCLLLVIATLGFFLVSGARLIALSAPHQRG